MPMWFSICQESKEVPQAIMVNIKEVLESEGLLTANELAVLENAVSGSQLTDVRQGVGDLTRRVEAGEKSEGLLARAGVGAYLLARQTQADKILAQVTRDGVAMFIHGQCLTSLNRPCDVPVLFVPQVESTMQKNFFAAWQPPPPAARSTHSRWDASGLIVATR